MNKFKVGDRVSYDGRMGTVTSYEDAQKAWRTLDPSVADHLWVLWDNALDRKPRRGYEEVLDRIVLVRRKVARLLPEWF